MTATLLPPKGSGILGKKRLALADLTKLFPTIKAITTASAGRATAGATISVNVDVPAGTVPGDLVLLFFAYVGQVNLGSTNTPTVTGGNGTWTAGGNRQATNNDTMGHSYEYYKTVGAGSEPAQYTVSVNSSQSGGAQGIVAVCITIDGSSTVGVGGQTGESGSAATSNTSVSTSTNWASTSDPHMLGFIAEHLTATINGTTGSADFESASNVAVYKEVYPGYTKGIVAQVTNTVGMTISLIVWAARGAGPTGNPLTAQTTLISGNASYNWGTLYRIVRGKNPDIIVPNITLGQMGMGPWATLYDPLPWDMNALEANFYTTGAVPSRVALDIGVGAAGSEQIIVPSFIPRIAQFSGGVVDDPVIIPCAAAAGKRLAVRGYASVSSVVPVLAVEGNILG